LLTACISITLMRPVLVKKLAGLLLLNNFDSSRLNIEPGMFEKIERRKIEI